MTLEEIQGKFIEEYHKYIKREGSEELLNYLKSTDFFTAPASSRFHASYEGGLCYHSLKTFYEVIRLLKAYSDVIQVSGETAAICALLHDVCKIECYQVDTKNVKKNGQWVQEPYYKFEEQFCFGGHGSKSVYLVQKYMKLTAEEATAINCHMGFSGGGDTQSISSAYEKNTFAWILHVADEASSFVLGV